MLYRALAATLVIVLLGGGCFPTRPKADVSDGDAADTGESGADTTPADTSEVGDTVPVDASDTSAGDDTATVACRGPSECPDPGPCQRATCAEGSCGAEPAGGSCDDGDPCTAIDACEGGRCVGSGTPDDTVGDWAFGFGGVGSERTAGLHPTATGGVAVYGSTDMSFRLGTDISGHVVDVQVPDGDAGAAFVARYSPDGQLIDAMRLATASEDLELRGSLVHADGSSTVVGFWRGTLVLGQAPNETTLESAGDALFVVRLSPAGLPVWTIKLSAGFDRSHIALCGTPDGRTAVMPLFRDSVAAELATGAGTLLSAPVQQNVSVWSGAITISSSGRVTGSFSPSTSDQTSRQVAVIGTACTLAPDGALLAGFFVLGRVKLTSSWILDGGSDEEGSPALVAFDSATKPMWFRHLAGSDKGMITAITGSLGGAVIALSDASATHIATEAGTMPYTGAAGPAVASFAADGTLRWLTTIFAPRGSSGSHIGGLSSGSGRLRGIGVQADYTIFGNAIPPVVVDHPAGDEAAQLFQVSFDELDGAALAASPLASSTQWRSSWWPPQDLSLASTGQDLFVGGAFSETANMHGELAATGPQDLFLLRANSGGALDCRR